MARKHLTPLDPAVTPPAQASAGVAVEDFPEVPPALAALMAEHERLDVSDGQRAVALIQRAERALAAGDHEAFEATLLDCAALEDHQRRHQARMRLVERAIGFDPKRPQELARAMGAALDHLLRWLADDPREPTLLGYAGVICCDLGLYKASDKLLSATQRLDPAFPNLERSLAAVRQRRRAGAKPDGIPADLRARLAGFGSRALQVAERARPATGMRISLCMIVRDEEEMIGRCLEAVGPGVDEIIVVDTGSRDRTVEICEEHGAIVRHHTWNGNFGSARNAGLDSATGDWILILDADEIIADGDAERMHRLAGSTWIEAFYLTVINHTATLEHGTAVQHSGLRLFRNRPHYRYVGRLHEQISQRMPGYAQDRFGHSDVRIDHYGYLGVVRDARDKARRNLELLERQRAEGPDSPFLLFNLGSEYGAVGDNAPALEYFEQAWKMLRGDPQLRAYGFAPSLATRYVRALLVNDRDQDALDAGDEVLKLFPGFTDVVFEQSIASHKLGQLDRARELLAECRRMGDAEARYSGSVGAGTHLPLERLAVIEAEEGNLDRAEELLQQVRSVNPGYLGVIDPFARLLLQRGRTPEETIEAVKRAGSLTPSALFLLAVNLQECGMMASAEGVLRETLELRPAMDAALVALADNVLSQGRIDEAAELAEQVPDDAGFAPQALRIALFALLAIEQPSEAQLQRRMKAVARLETVGINADDRAVLAAWAAQRSGRTPASLPVGAVESMVPMFDALLRLGAADSFADLVAVLAASQVSLRQQRELIAPLFLRHGLLDLATEEWVSLLQDDGPDASVYSGLALVARARGLDEDARQLVEEALTLEPRHPLATRVLEELAA